MSSSESSELIVFPLPKQVVFPSNFVNLTIRGTLGVKWAESLLENNAAYVALCPSTSSLRRNLSATDLTPIATKAKVVSITRLRGSKGPGFRLVARGISRVAIKFYVQEEPCFIAETTALPDIEDATQEDAREFRALVASFVAIVRPPERALREKLRLLIDSAPLGLLADTYASIWKSQLKDKLELLQSVNISERIRIVSRLIKARMAQQSKDTQAPQAQGEGDDQVDDIKLLEKRLEEAEIPEEQYKALKKDLKRLERLQNQSAEKDLLRNYLEFAADLPWSIFSEDEISLEGASKQLEADHCGLVDVKRRVLEYISVLKMRKDMKGPILCFMGPPGVGKSSIAKSIATAMGRPFVRISLGGVSDEAVIRGHRRTYIGAMPGRILSALRTAGSSSPVVLLDEIDKMGRDHRGDPAAALLEVLDPVQNDKFTDNYLNLPFDLSKVLWIATGNYFAGVPAPLQDRMEIIEVAGYSDEEKVKIAQEHLVAQQLEIHGLPADAISFTDEALMSIARHYSRESGVRKMNKQIAACVRFLTAKMVRSQEKEISSTLSSFVVTPDLVEEILGPAQFEEVGRSLEQRLSRPGVSTGLAWTGLGGGAVLFIEASKMPGKGKLILTGQLGDVMRESAQTALSWIRSNASSSALQIPESEGFLEGQDVHLHFPAGATKKDGPSAGVAITVALVSLFSGRLVRPDCAMTGEMSLRGVVLPVGGVKEKCVAAVRNGINVVFMPARNARKDLHDLSEAVRSRVSVVGVDHIEQVLEQVFQGAPPATKMPKRSNL